MADKGILFNILYWSIPVVVFYLGLVAYLRDKKSSTNRTFFGFTLLLVTWAVITPLYMSPGNKIILLYLARLANSLIFWACPAYYHFCKVFPNKKTEISKVETGFILINIVLAFITIFSGFITKGIKIYDWGVSGLNGQGFPLLISWFAAYLIVSNIILYRKLKNAKGRERSQIQYVFLALALLSIYLFPINLIYPLITGQSRYDYYGPLGIMFFIGFTYYAIAKHRLMDIKLVVLKSAVYTVVIALLASTYILLVFYLKKYYEKIINPDAVFIIASIIIVFGFQPLRRFLQKYADKIFAKGQYNFEELLKKISNILSSNLVLTSLVPDLLNTLSSEIRINRLAFYKADYQKDTGFKFSQADNKKLLNIGNKSLLVADELEDDSPTKKLMQKLGIEVLVFLPDSENNTLGFLALSEKASGDAYTARDLKLLEIIAPQISIALKNIEQQQQMIEQIVEERQRINQDAHDHIYNRLGALAKKAEVALLNPKEAESTLKLLKNDLRQSISDLQRIVSGQVEEDNKKSAILEGLKSLCNDFIKKSEIKLSYDFDERFVLKLQPQCFWHLQCILEECLNNISKHSKATQAEVSIKQNDDLLTLQVSDNGIGLHKQGKRVKDHQGLKGMQERAKKLNARISLSSNNGKGTKVELRIPC